MNSLSRLKEKLDTTSIILAFVLAFIGVALVYSATFHNDTVWMRNLWRNQLIWIALGTGVLYLTIRLPARIMYDYAYLFYFATLILLALVLVNGRVTLGATRWFSVGPFKVQPSEFAKIGTLVLLARVMSSSEISFERLTTLVLPSLIALTPMILILKQPDLGTAIVFGGMFIPMLFWAGLSAYETFFVISPILSLILAFNTWLWAGFFILLFVLLWRHSRHLLVTTGILIVNFSIGIVLPIFWNRLHDYQKDRILSFVDPHIDPTGAGYQVLQSNVSIGSGRIFGKGYLSGTQTSLSFLPEQHTDFIFSVLGEQFGFLGCLVVLILFLVLILRLFHTATEYGNRFLNLLAVGAASQLAFHVIVNIAMTIGLMPVVGIPLPFLSYGGSFLLTCMILMGIAVSIPIKSGEY